MKTLFFYVHKTDLLDYFIRPICQFLSDKYKITILHLNKKNGYTDKQYGEFEMIDISDYGYTQTKELLLKAKPESMILPGFISIFELYMLRLATSLSVPTIFLEHGIYSRETAHLPYKKLFSTHLYHILSRNLYFLYRYTIFAIKSGNTSKELSVLYNALKRKDYSCTQFSHAFFFAQYGFEQINSYFHYPEGRYSFTGYPIANDNEEFNSYEQLARTTSSQKSGKAVYIHQPFIKDRLTKWTYEDEKKMLLKVAEDLKKENLSLQIAVHPRESLSLYQKLYEETDITIKEKNDKQEYAFYDLVIGHYSTALMYALFFNKPLWIIDYDTIKSTENSPYAPVNSYNTSPKTNITHLKNFLIGDGYLSFENIADSIVKFITKQ